MFTNEFDKLCCMCAIHMKASFVHHFPARLLKMLANFMDGIEIDFVGIGISISRFRFLARHNSQFMTTDHY